MGKLKTIQPRIMPLAPRLRYVETDERERFRTRDRVQHWRAWYKTARWQQLRFQVLTRDLFQCQRCGVIEADTSRLVCDHVEPHRGDETKFWNGPFQTLCKPCHDIHKQREERAAG